MSWSLSNAGDNGVNIGIWSWQLSSALGGSTKCRYQSYWWYSWSHQVTCRSRLEKCQCWSSLLYILMYKAKYMDIRCLRYLLIWAQQWSWWSWFSCKSVYWPVYLLFLLSIIAEVGLSVMRQAKYYDGTTMLRPPPPILRGPLTNSSSTSSEALCHQLRQPQTHRACRWWSTGQLALIPAPIHLSTTTNPGTIPTANTPTPTSPIRRWR